MSPPRLRWPLGDDRFIEEGQREPAHFKEARAWEGSGAVQEVVGVIPIKSWGELYNQ